MTRYDELETTAQKVYKYLTDKYGKHNPKRVPYKDIADEIGGTRSGVAYAVGVLIRKDKLIIQDGKLAVIG